MAETIFFDVSDGGLEKYGIGKDKQALTSGLHCSAGGITERRRGGEWRRVASQLGRQLGRQSRATSTR